MDNFEDFCLAIYQQIENIVICLFSDLSFQEKVLKDKDLPAYHNFEKDNTGKYLKDEFGKNLTVRSGNYKISNLFSQSMNYTVINDEYNKDLNTWSFNRKLKAIVYYYYFNAYILNNNQKEFETVCENVNEIYQMRNLNHRGNLKSESQRNIIDKILPRNSNYYFKFLGIFEDFVTKINSNL